MKNKPNYGTWIRKKKMYTCEAITIVFIGLSCCSFIHFLFIVAIFPASIFLYIACILMLTSYRFSRKGGDYQNKIHELIIQRVAGKKVMLDIGCGNGNLAIKHAKKHPTCGVIGLDFWGKEWEYAASICENNARIENVSNIRFIQGSASQLPGIMPDFS
jgi:SAM-dependent methyltransferase